MRRLRIAVIGAGSTYTPELVEGLLKRNDTLPLSELRLMDIDPEKNRIVGGLVERMLGGSGVQVRRTEDLEDAIAGVDFVIAQVRVGRLAARELDETIPLKYGLLGQETTGIGGMLKALRTIPVLQQVAQVMERVAPEAWLINFSNPSGLVAQALLDEKPDRKLIGLCNVPINMQAQAARMLGADPDTLQYGFVGLNHLLFLNSVVEDGRERIGELLAMPQQTIQKNVPDMPADSALLQAIGAIPCSYLNYFYHPRATLQKCMEAAQCRAQQCMDIETELLAQYTDETLCVKPTALEKRGGALYSEAAISLVDAIFNDTGAEHVVNVANRGAYPFMAAEDVVEVPCRIDKTGAHPIALRAPASPQIVGLMQAVKAYERLTAIAARTGDYGSALAALAVHPLIQDMDAAKPCLQELMEAHRVYLPQFFREEQA